MVMRMLAFIVARRVLALIGLGPSSDATNSVAVARPRVDVYAFLADFENIPQWHYAISRAWKVSDGTVRVGSTYRQTRTVPKHAEEIVEVTEYDLDRRLPYRAHSGHSHCGRPTGSRTLATPR
jgi:hypothetical protein